ncbi:hypothetical protein I4U23_003440 [Adineta vaga]|nr:hypothetical protein I4U23_003440 [Adineta vaga]
MATSTGKTLCLKCNKVKCTSRCGGCLQDFCFKHMEDHRQELNQQLDEIVLDHDLFRQSLNEQMKDPKCHSLMKEVDIWERLESVTETCENNIYTSKMARLMSKLGTTHQQIDEYSRRRIQQIDEEVAAAINRIVAETQIQQQTLLADANVRSAAIEEEYKHKLQRYVEEINTVKAQNLSLLEKDLNLRQEMILEEARKRIDDLNEEANRLKMGVLRDTQAQANAKVEAITEQVAASSAKDAAVVVGATPKIKLKHRQQ